MHTKFFTWEGRCYENKYNNRDMSNIYISVLENIDNMLVDFKKFEEVEDIERIYNPHNDPKKDNDFERYATIIISDQNRDNFFKILELQGFKADPPKKLFLK
jgi:hypothetical protein